MNIFCALSNSSLVSILPVLVTLVAFRRAPDLELFDILVCRVVVLRDTDVIRGGDKAVVRTPFWFEFEKKAPNVFYIPLDSALAAFSS